VELYRMWHMLVITDATPLQVNVTPFMSWFSCIETGSQRWYTSPYDNAVWRMQTPTLWQNIQLSRDTLWHLLRQLTIW